MAPPGMIEEISRELQEAGLTVAAPRASYLGWAEMMVYGGEISTQIGTIYSDMGTISYVENQWCFCVKKSIPGREDIEHCVASVEELVSVILQYFLGEPLTIEGWIVPKHRHPEWNEHHLRLAIAQAQPLPFSTWKQVRQRAKAHYDRLLRESHSGLTKHRRTVAWDEWYSCLFVPCVRRPLAEFEKPSHEETLWIRRDLLEAYLVQEQ